MEKFVKEIRDNVSLDFGLEELKEIRDATEGLIKRLSEAVVKVNPMFEVKALVPCGSMAEHTRNWKFAGTNREPIIEFDFLAILKNPPQDEITTIQHCDGFMQVIDENEYLKRYCNKFPAVEPENGLQGDRISFSFKLDILRSVNHLCSCFSFDDKMEFLQKDECCKYVLHGNVKQTGVGCEHCTEYKKTGHMQIATGTEISSPYFNHSSLVFKWTSKSKTLKAPDLVNFEGRESLSHLFILVDFLPSFEIMKMNGLESNDECSNASPTELRHNCYLVPKACIKNHPTCWKISHCATEIGLLQMASQEHRFAYMILKFMSDCLFCDYYEDTSLPTTYKVKTAVLHHIKKCSLAPQSCDLYKSVNQILLDLSVCFSNQNLLNFTNGLNLLTANKTDSLPLQNQLWHKNRCKIIGDCYHFMSIIFESFQDTSSENSLQCRISLKNGIKMLKYIGRTFKLAWTQTEIDPIYHVDTEKLKGQIEIELAKQDSFSEVVDASLADLVIRQESPNEHWTKKLKVWEYKAVREMYALHHYECPNPPGKTPGREENILLQAQMTCDFFSWAHEDQQEWMSKLAKSENPDDIVTALKAVDMYYVDVKIKRTSQGLSQQKQTNISKK